MFLATTALSEFWDCDEELLFISPTCLLYSEKHKWSKLNYQILPCPWDDRQRFYEAGEYLSICTEKILNQLVDYLNVVHNTQLSHTYWRLIVGYWLFIYLHTLYDRYTLLKEAFKQYPSLRTVLLDPSDFIKHRDARGYIDSSFSDAFNLQLFSQILTSLGYQFPSRSLFPKTLDTTRTDASEANLEIAPDRLPAPTVHAKLCPTVLLGNLYCDLSVRTVLLNALNPQLESYVFDTIGLTQANFQPIFDLRRTGLASLQAADEFEQCVVEMLPQNFPTLYLEGFSSFRLATLNNSLPLPAVLISVTEWYTCESFKFLAAEAAEQGAHLISGDHGGGYGFMRVSVLDFYDRKFASKLVTCGWGDRSCSINLNLPSLYTSSLLDRKASSAISQRFNTILLTSRSVWRYLLRFEPDQAAGHAEYYWLWQVKFIQSLPDSLRQLLTCRTHRDDQFEIAQRLADAFPGLEIESEWKASFRQQLEECRIFVLDHPSSTMLEAAVSNVPSVMFWNPQCWEVPDDAEPYFDELRRVGILWDSPEAAAAHVAAIYDDPWAWWGQPEVQQVRQQFVDRFALAREDWCEQWTQALLDELILSCQSWLEREPDNPEPMNGISQAYLRKGDRTKALEHCQQTLAQHPDNVEAHRILGSILAAQGNDRQAYQAYQAALERDPNLVAAHLELAEVCDRLGHPTEARDHRYQAYTLEPSTATSQEYYELGIDFQQSGDRERAADCYRQAIALDPSLTRAYLRLGRSLAGQGKLGSALRWYSKAVLLRLRYQLGL